jgi:hypothetical protein
MGISGRPGKWIKYKQADINNGRGDILEWEKQDIIIDSVLLTSKIRRRKYEYYCQRTPSRDHTCIA